MKDKQLLEGIISDYYNSIEDSFFYRRKNLWKSNTATLLFVLSVLFFFGNIIPLFPAFKDDYLLWLFNKIKTNFTIGIEDYSFWIKWALGTFWSALIEGILFIPFKFWDRKESKRFLKS